MGTSYGVGLGVAAEAAAGDVLRREPGTNGHSPWAGGRGEAVAAAGLEQEWECWCCAGMVRERGRLGGS